MPTREATLRVRHEVSVLKYAKSGFKQKTPAPSDEGVTSSSKRTASSRSSNTRAQTPRTQSTRTQSSPRLQQPASRTVEAALDKTLIERRGRGPVFVIAATLVIGAAAGAFFMMSADDRQARADTSTLDVVAEAERLHAERERLTLEQAEPPPVDERAASPSPSSSAASTTASAVASTSTNPLAASTPAPVKVTITDRVRSGETLSHALGRHGITGDTVNTLVAALKGTLDMRSIRPGDAYTLVEDRAEGTKTAGLTSLDAFEYRPKNSLAPVVIEATKKTAGTGYDVKKTETPVVSKVVALSGVVTSSLYNAMRDRGENIQLVNNFVDVFAWNVDFYRETQKGDRYKVIVEKQYAEGRFVGYGRVLAAEYVNAGEVHRGFRFKSKDEKVHGTFDDKGESIERTFLKSPLEITRVTSNFGQRFHPVLKSWRQHKGIDYGAPRGTPFWAVADGTVERAEYSSTAGNMIVLRHSNGYTSEYFHANAFAPGIRVGTKVRQRQVIGYVGNTGRSTGPHLHFGLLRANGHIDPAKQKFPSAKPVPSTHLEEYTKAIGALRAELEALEVS